MTKTRVSLHWDEHNESFERVRRQHREHGWASVGAHFVIDTNGVLHKGRSLEWPSMYDPEKPNESIAVLLLGRGLRRPTHDQFDTLSQLRIDLCAELCSGGVLPCEHGITFPDQAP